MALMARVSLAGPELDEPEDYFESALSTIFPDDAVNQHGDKDHDVLYTAPSLPKPLRLTLTHADDQADRSLFSHFLWNASLLLAEFVEAATWRDARGKAGEDGVTSRLGRVADFNVTGLSTLELGAGTALPSILAAHLGAGRVTVTDYPSDAVMTNLRANIDRNVFGLLAADDEVAGGVRTQGARTALPPVTVEGHAWGALDTPLAQDGRHAYDRIFVCDCLWMPWQHANLRKSIAWFLKEGGAPSSTPVCWVVAGFHTGRVKVAAFFNEAALAADGLEVQRIWERDCNGEERPWTADRGIEDKSERKRWLVMAILQRCGPSSHAAADNHN